MVSAMAKSLIKTTILAGALGLLILCVASCSKSIDPNKLAVDQEAASPPPNVANVIKIEPPVKEPVPAALTHTQNQPPPEPIFPNHPLIVRHWLMLLGVLLLFFLLSLMLFHSMGRRLHKRTLRAHAPTRHANIWASHKPPQFLDP